MEQEIIDRILESNSRVSDDICEAVEPKEMDELSKNEVFQRWLEYLGIIGYSGQIKESIKLIYGVELK